MAKQTPFKSQNYPEDVGLTPSLESLHRLVTEQKARFRGVEDIYSYAKSVYDREKLILENAEDRLETLRQGQLSL